MVLGLRNCPDSRRPDPLRVLALCCVTAAGTLGLISSGTAAAAASGPCGAAPAARATASAEPAPLRTGAVRLSNRPGGWLIRAPLRRAPSYVSQSFGPTGQLTLTFCLRAPRGAATRIVQVTAGGIQLSLRDGHLRLSASRPGRFSKAARSLTVTGHPTAIRLAISDGGRRVVLDAAGKRQAAFSGGPANARVLRIGSLTSSHGGTLTLSNVTIVLPRAQVIPPSTPGASSGSGSGSGSGPGSGAAGSSGPPPFIDQLAPWPGNPFSPTSFWNAPLPANAPLDPSSSAYVTEINRQVKDYHTWMETGAYSVPVYVVGPQQSNQHVTLDTWGPDLQAAFDAVPIPSTAQAAAGTDEDMTVWQPSTDRMWDFWGMRKEADGWHARWGGEMDNVSHDPGYFTHLGQTANWGATATGLPLLGGLVTEADLQRGYINHALAINLVETDKAYWSWPAQRTDGDYWSTGITPIPEGTRFRLPPTLNIASLNLPPIDRMLAQAAQKYGMVVADKGPIVAFFGEDPKTIGSNPWPAEFQNQYPNNVLAKFPWGDLETLKLQLGCCWFVGA
jgi:hypothetical protein